MAFLILLGAVFRNALKTYRSSADPLFSGIALGYLGAFVGLLVHAVGANTFIIVRIMEPFWFLTAIVFLIPSIEERENSGKNGFANAHTGQNTKMLLTR
jgi:hypothetical protein